MNCIEHNDRNAVNTCAKCGAGLCNDCINSSIFKSDNNQPYCKKCNYELACENDRLYNKQLRVKKIIVGIYIGAVAAGVILFVFLRITTNYDERLLILAMLLCWALGSISCFFDNNLWLFNYVIFVRNGFNRAANSKNLYFKIINYISSLILAVLGLAIMGAFSPILIITYLIGIGRVKKQITENNVILSQIQTENKQN